MGDPSLSPGSPGLLGAEGSKAGCFAYNAHPSTRPKRRPISALPWCQPQEFIRSDFHQHDPQIILFFDLVQFDFSLVILADFERVELRELHGPIGLQKVRLLLPPQDFTTGVISRVKIGYNGIPDRGWL